MQEREIYEAELKARLDDQEELRTAEVKGVEKGVKIGFEQGREEGIAAGKAEGMQQALNRLTDSGIPIDEARRLLGMA
jgi:flagellar biosynthesis/type III secretory pathway protein FliH